MNSFIRTRKHELHYKVKHEEMFYDRHTALTPVLVKTDRFLKEWPLREKILK